MNNQVYRNKILERVSKVYAKKILLENFLRLIFFKIKREPICKKEKAMHVVKITTSPKNKCFCGALEVENKGNHFILTTTSSYSDCITIGYV